MSRPSDVHEISYDDIDEVLLLSQRLEEVRTKKEDLIPYIEDGNLSGYVLKDVTVRAYVLIRFELDECEIDQIVVSKEDEGKGMASFLLDEVLSLLKERNIKKVFLEVREDNSKAVSLYERHGFSSYYVRKNYYGDKDAVMMSKEIH